MGAENKYHRFSYNRVVFASFSQFSLLLKADENQGRSSLVFSLKKGKFKFCVPTF